METTAGRLRTVTAHAGAEPRIRPDRLTLTAGISILVIAAGHTLVFAFHRWWGPWLAGPFRAEQLPLEAAVQFWALPGGLVVPGVLLGLLMIDAGRRGTTLPRFVGATLIVWALACVWMVGPSGFLTLLVPGALLVAAGFRRGAASPERARAAGGRPAGRGI